MKCDSSNNQVIFDGQCPVCNSLKYIAKNNVNTKKLVFTPYQNLDFEQTFSGFTFDEAQHALFVFDKSGEHVKGAKAVILLLGEFPGVWKWIGKVVSRPPLFWLADLTYRFFARHRIKISRWFIK